MIPLDPPTRRKIAVAAAEAAVVDVARAFFADCVRDSLLALFAICFALAFCCVLQPLHARVSLFLAGLLPSFTIQRYDLLVRMEMVPVFFNDDVMLLFGSRVLEDLFFLSLIYFLFS